MPSGTLTGFITENSSGLQENIGTASYKLMASTNNLFNKMVGSKAGRIDATALSSGYGRNWIRLKTFQRRSMTGVSRGGNLNNFRTTLLGGATTGIGSRHYSQAVSDDMLSGDGSVYGTPFRQASTLYAIEHTLRIPHDHLKAEALEAAITTFTDDLLPGFGERVGFIPGLMFWTDERGRLATIQNGTDAIVPNVIGDKTGSSIGYTVVEISLGDAGAFERFRYGMDVDILYTDSDVLYRANNTNTGARSNVIVEGFDPSKNTVLLGVVQADAVGASGWLVNNTVRTLPDNAFITIGNIHQVLPGGSDAPSSEDNQVVVGTGKIYGWRDVAKTADATDVADRTIFGNDTALTGLDRIDVRQHREFASWYKKNVGRLTSRKLHGYLKNYEKSCRVYENTIDHLAFSYGIYEDMLNLHNASAYRDSRMPDDFAGFGRTMDNLQVPFNGGQLTLLPDESMLEPGLILGMRCNDNWEVVVPPNAPGATEQQLAGFESYDKIPFQFQGRSIGFGSDAVPIPGNGAFKVDVDMPGYTAMQIEPKKQTSMFVLDGVDVTDLTPDTDAINVL